MVTLNLRSLQRYQQYCSRLRILIDLVRISSLAKYLAPRVGRVDSRIREQRLRRASDGHVCVQVQDRLVNCRTGTWTHWRSFTHPRFVLRGLWKDWGGYLLTIFRHWGDEDLGWWLNHIFLEPYKDSRFLCTPFRTGGSFIRAPALFRSRISDVSSWRKQ